MRRLKSLWLYAKFSPKARYGFKSWRKPFKTPEMITLQFGPRAEGTPKQEPRALITGNWVPIEVGRQVLILVGTLRTVLIFAARSRPKPTERGKWEPAARRHS